jgi:hypothetical protein
MSSSGSGEASAAICADARKVALLGGGSPAPSFAAAAATAAAAAALKRPLPALRGAKPSSKPSSSSRGLCLPQTKMALC